MARVAWVLLAVTLLLPIPSLAQEATAPLTLLEDGAGDVKAHAAGSPTAIPGPATDAMDLRSLSAQETPAEILLTVGAQTIDPGATQAVVQYRVEFRHVDTTYQLLLFVASQIGGGPVYEGSLLVLDGTSEYGTYIDEVPVTGDLTANTLTAAIPRHLLADSQGAPPFPGRFLDQFVATAGFLQATTLNVAVASSESPYVQDRMPDAGFGQVALPVQFGIAQAGNLRLSSDEPFRTSNGEASTFVFRVNATNLGAEQLAEFVAVDAPAAWDVRVPGMVRLPANGTVEVPIIVRTAFAHVHGTSTVFTIELIGQDGQGSVGRVQIGLRYPKIAQPAGHHDEVYLHTLDFSEQPANLAVALALRAFAGGDHAREPYFNTAPPEEDDQDAEAPVIGQYCALRALDNDTVGSTYCWEAVLKPGLEMGLDFDLASEGSYSVPIHSLYPQPDARIEGRLVYYAPIGDPNDPLAEFDRETIIVADLLASDKAGLVANEDHVFTGVVKARPEGDLLTYVRGAELHLELELLNGRPDNFYIGPKLEPELLPGAFMRLPLLEYEDPIDEVFGAVTSVHLVLDGNGHRQANPGDTVVYSVTMHNAAQEEHGFTAALVGSNRAWGRIVGAERFDVDADGSRTLTLAVTVPADALDEDRADLVLEVASRDDISARALMRLVTTVDTDAEHEDQSALLGEPGPAKGSPMPSSAFLALALVALALAQRRSNRKE